MLQSQSDREAGASVVIKNISGGDYAIVELGSTIIADVATLDLMDEELPAFYDNWNMVNSLVTEANSSQLWADIQVGKIELVSSTPPTMTIHGAP